LLLSGARGAWLAAGLAGLGWILSEMRRSSRLRTLDTLAVAVMAGSVLVLLLGLKGAAELPLLERLDSRLVLYGGTLQLNRDYLFTGAGLGTFPMLYSAYVLGLEVVSLTHPHNLYLSVWLEQGLLGLVALLWLGYAFFRTYRRRREGSAAHHLLASACCWAMVVIFVHGLIDSVPYNSRFVPLLFIPLGLSGFLGRRPAPVAAARAPATRIGFRRSAAFGSLAGVILLGLLVWGWRPALAGWYANLGAVAQARIELGGYHWPDRIPSRVRATADLSRPVLLFERALALAPGNATARERLALIGISDR
jgi:hypothetical protein